MANDYPQIQLLEDWSLKVTKKSEISKEMIEQIILIQKIENIIESYGTIWLDSFGILSNELTNYIN